MMHRTILLHHWWVTAMVLMPRASWCTQIRHWAWRHLVKSASTRPRIWRLFGHRVLTIMLYNLLGHWVLRLLGLLLLIEMLGLEIPIRVVWEIGRWEHWRHLLPILHCLHLPHIIAVLHLFHCWRWLLLKLLGKLWRRRNRFEEFLRLLLLLQEGLLLLLILRLGVKVHLLELGWLRRRRHRWL